MLGLWIVQFQRKKFIEFEDRKPPARLDPSPVVTDPRRLLRDDDRRPPREREMAAEVEYRRRQQEEDDYQEFLRFREEREIMRRQQENQGRVVRDMLPYEPAYMNQRGYVPLLPLNSTMTRFDNQRGRYSEMATRTAITPYETPGYRQDFQDPFYHDNRRSTYHHRHDDDPFDRYPRRFY